MKTEAMNVVATPEEQQLASLNLMLIQQFTQAMIHDDSLMAEVPYAATLVLLPDDQPELAEANLQGAIDSAQEGRNVYIRHVCRRDAPDATHGEATYSPYPPKSRTNQTQHDDLQ